MKLHPITRNDNSKWNSCGPAAIAAILGTGTAHARELMKTAIKDVLFDDSRRLVHAVYDKELLATLRYCGYECKELSITGRGSLATELWGLKQKKISGQFMICIIGHVLVYDSETETIIDNHYPNGTHPYLYSFLEEKCRKIWILSNDGFEEL